AEQPDRDPGHHRQRDPQDEHAPYRPRSRTEGDTNADLASALREQIADDGVDADEAEQQRHAARDREQHERQRSALRRTRFKILEGAYVRERQARVDGPDRALNILQES